VVPAAPESGAPQPATGWPSVPGASPSVPAPRSRQERPTDQRTPGPAARTVDVSDRGEAVCVIGAGGSGLAAIKNFKQYGFDVDCYERETGIGGAWNWRHDRSPVYASTHLISSKPFTQFPDFPMPDDWPDYPHHSRLLSYFERYADHFGLRENIWFGTEVVRVTPTDEDDPATSWDVTVRGVRGGSDKTLRYAAVVVANGHNWAPKLPSYPGLDEFGGTVLHASAYKDAAQIRGRRVLVVGAGNTGCDIAVEAAQQGAKCWHSSRRGYWYAPKYAFGKPADQVNDRVLGLGVPLKLRQWLFHLTLRLTVGDLQRFGLPKPDHKIYETHPIANSQLVYHVGHGGITPMPDIERFERNQVVFTDGRTADPDVVVLATGYLPRFEFLAPQFFGGDERGRPHLRWQLFSPGHPTLSFIGLIQPDGGVFSISHWQSELAAAWLRLRDTAPERATAWWRTAAEPGGRYADAAVKDSSRHWLEISHWVYLKALQRALNGLTSEKVST
jgi:cation diffusion facilitator CzcD-associated flavoprotein CzcO